MKTRSIAEPYRAGPCILRACLTVGAGTWHISFYFDHRKLGVGSPGASIQVGGYSIKRISTVSDELDYYKVVLGVLQNFIWPVGKASTSQLYPIHFATRHVHPPTTTQSYHLGVPSATAKTLLGMTRFGREFNLESFNDVTQNVRKHFGPELRQP